MQRAGRVVAGWGRLLAAPGSAACTRSYSTGPNASPVAQQGSPRLGRLAAVAAAAAAALGLLPVAQAEPAREQQPPSPEELAKPGATSIRMAEGLEGKLSGMYYHGADKGETNPYAHPDPRQQQDAHGLPLVRAQLGFAPAVPPPCTHKHPVHVVAELESVTKTLHISPLHKYHCWTFNGTVPGPMIRCCVGDVLEVRHTNKDSDGIGHNIDLHCVTGPGGGAAVTYVEVDETRTATFKMLQPGVFIYHCAAAPLPTHVANGMYGLVVVEPEGGLPHVDKVGAREFYVLQSEFYGEDSEDTPGMLDYDYFKGLCEQPAYVVFNGAEGSMTEKAPLVADQGDRVRIWFGNAGPNLVSSFHVIGAIFDKVYRDGDLISPPARGIQTVLVPAGGATMVEFSVPVPGALTLIDHSIFRTDKGAVGFLKVRPQGNDKRRDIFDSNEPPNPCPGCKMHN
ncbi:Copper-containing nitrite reductase [Chlorella sorokiniana]|uniref:Copper-containing nitrite reductase n=1 Tax=Chlorella sorokiniana TaxID=3076 RepID=A0A2P6TUD4_CHLSO|nr:Copper-containing nitrite reductase [Chlorella sorokiniana]|eukprot:PRW57688.1 Copper-containing nitrite reductase [Chlorella sorokiniana]